MPRTDVPYNAPGIYEGHFMGTLHAYLAGLGVLACGVGASGRAAADDAETVWACWYDRSTSVLCRLLTAPASPIETAVESPLPLVVPASSRPGAVLPPLAHVISEAPARLGGRTVRIPLHNHAHNMDAVEQLAEAVMCGARSDCRVLFEHG